ncbi:MAG: hypothetical protein KKB70_00815 [Proteobacteria bacterium]|nr:hypothetical protein [Pseudomonadota bacterium]MBU1611829.1 hypothetical protein [Pseudomonadota bacterium]
MKQLAIFLLALSLLTLSLLSQAGFARADAQSQKWYAEEQKCLAKCPKLPRFGGTETAKQFQERIKKTDKYNACQKACTEEYLNRVSPKREPFDDGSKGYFKRNQ